jgi:hypothetical protein
MVNANPSPASFFKEEPMNIRTSPRRSLRPFAAALVTAAVYGCGQQQVPADTAALPQPESRTAAPRQAAPPAPRESRVTVPPGTELQMTLASPVGSATSQVGDSVTGTTTSAIVVGDDVAIPVGSTVFGRVTGVDPATKGLKVSEKGGGLVLSFTKVTTPAGYSSPMSATLTSAAHSSGKTAGIIGGSAAGGALLGKILGGHTKDAAIGAAVGGGIGTGIAAGTKGKEVVLPAGSTISVKLDQPLTIARRS